MVMARERPIGADRDGAGRISPLPPGSIEVGGERGAVRLSPHQRPNGCQGQRFAEPASGKDGRRGVLRDERRQEHDPRGAVDWD
jgi:hypothetical protein